MTPGPDRGRGIPAEKEAGCPSPLRKVFVLGFFLVNYATSRGKGASKVSLARPDFLGALRSRISIGARGVIFVLDVKPFFVVVFYRYKGVLQQPVTRFCATDVDIRPYEKPGQPLCEVYHLCRFAYPR